jgi:hypothetical protein
MSRVSIRYQDGTTVEAGNLADAVFHVAHTGLSYVLDIVEDIPAVEPCPKCGGTGVRDAPAPGVVLSRDELESKVAAINAEAPVGEATFDERVAKARELAVSD